MRFLRLLESPLRVIERLYRHLVRREVIFFAVMRGSDKMRVRGELVKLCGSHMGIICHGVTSGTCAN